MMCTGTFAPTRLTVMTPSTDSAGAETMPLAAVLLTAVRSALRMSAAVVPGPSAVALTRGVAVKPAAA